MKKMLAILLTVALALTATAALAEPEGRELERSLEKAGIEPRAPAAKPIVWMKKPRGAASTVVTSR